MSRLSEVFKFKGRKKAPKPAQTPRPIETTLITPIIKDRSKLLDKLSPALRYALQSDRAYRTFPDDLPESAIPTTCDNCGNPFDGPTQSHCRACGGGRSAYKVDVTDNPYYTLPPEINGDAPKVDPDELIPTFGGADVKLGNGSSSERISGGKITIGNQSRVKRISGNQVELGTETRTDVVVAKNKIQVFGLDLLMLDSDGGLTAKEIILGSSAKIWGKIVIPNAGTLSMKNNCQIERIIVGANTTLTAEDDLKVAILIILGPNVKIALGKGCTISRIVSDFDYEMSAGEGFSNPTRTAPQKEYNLVVEIGSLIKQALSFTQ